MNKKLMYMTYVITVLYFVMIIALAGCGVRGGIINNSRASDIIEYGRGLYPPAEIKFPKGYNKAPKKVRVPKMKKLKKFKVFKVKKLKNNKKEK